MNTHWRIWVKQWEIKYNELNCNKIIYFESETLIADIWLWKPRPRPFEDPWKPHTVRKKLDRKKRMMGGIFAYILFIKLALLCRAFCAPGVILNFILKILARYPLDTR